MFNATEYGAANMISTQRDVYSYGILILEMVTGKSPTDSMFTQGLNLHKYAEMAIHCGVMDVVDMRLFLSLGRVHQPRMTLLLCQECMNLLMRKGLTA
jgi:serine/threonine protein kinase